jgi:tetratricopeptide (TPR) repeat protein
MVRKLIEVEYNRPISEKLINLVNKLDSAKSIEAIENYNYSNDLEKRKRADDFRRIKDVIEHALILNLLVNNSTNYSNLFLQKGRLRALTTYAEIIKSRGALRSAVKLLDNCEKVARHYQLYDQLIDILYIKSDIGFNGSKYYNLENILSDINHFEKCRRRVKEAKIIYRDYFSKTIKKGINKGDTKILKKSIDKLDKYFAETSSNLILLKRHLFKMELSLVTDRYDEGTETGLEAIKLLEENENVKTNSRIGYFHFNIAETELGAFRFESSLWHATKAKSYVSSNSLNSLISSQFIVLACINLNQLVIALNEISQLQKLKVLSSYPFYQSKFYYYQAMIYFLQEDFDKAWKALSRQFDLEKDKEGWRVWLSIMRMLCQIEREELVDVDFMIQSFRKYIKRWEKRSEIGEREKLVFRVIETLNRNHFDYLATAKEETDTLASLRAKQGSLKWRPNSPELIIFHNWFDAKAEKTSYKPNYQTYKLEEKVEKTRLYI